MENIGLYIIGILMILVVCYHLENKKNKYWRDYFKEQYFKEKDINDNYIKDGDDNSPLSELAIKLRLLKAKFKQQSAFSMNVNMQVASKVTDAEIKELELIIKELTK